MVKSEEVQNPIKAGYDLTIARVKLKKFGIKTRSKQQNNCRGGELVFGIKEVFKKFKG